MERKLALQFVEEQGKDVPVMLVPPPILYMFNNKPIDYSKYNPSINQDSLSFHESKFLQYISDSIFLEKYLNAFIESTNNYGFKVFLPQDIEEFISLKEVAYVLRFAQMELVEDTLSWEIVEQINFRKTSKIVPLNKVSLSTWFEISQKDSASYYTYFDEQFINDESFGEFRQELWSMDIKYDYTVLEIELENIYDLASDLGELHASYFYDLILNTYIWNHLPEDRKEYYIYLHYNHDYHSVESADRSFIRLEKDD